MKDKIAQGYLYDFYGELLNVHQRTIFEDFVLNDLSLSEIAAEQGISRQGVHDVIRRSTKTLEGYEEKLHLIDKFVAIRDKVEQIDTLVRTSHREQVEQTLQEIATISNQILEEL